MDSPETVTHRIGARTFPSVFQAWNPADNLPQEHPLDTAARHDLLWNVPEYFGLQWNNPSRLLSDGFVEASLVNGRSVRSALLERNPSIVLLSEVRWHDAPASDLPDTSAWWQRDSNGQRLVGWPEGTQYLLDWHDPDFRAQVANQAGALMTSDVVDGILLDWWSEETDDPDRLLLLEQVRQSIGPDALILVNSGLGTPLSSAAHINGLYMETTIPSGAAEADEWQRAARTLLWAERSLCTPTLNALETWTCTGAPPYRVPCTPDARSRLNRMRATTTLVLTHSNGYALFADANGLPTADHLHDWYPFWDRSIGRPAGGLAQRSDGGVQRDFESGTVVYNPVDNRAILVTFDAPRRSVATGETASSFTVGALDGDLYLSLV